MSTTVPVTTSNPSTPGVPFFTYVSTIVAGADGLTGTVRRADGQPAAGADVRLLQVYDEGIYAQTTTDAAGHYELAAPAGIYQVAFVSSLDEPPIVGGLNVYHDVGYWLLTLATGGTTQLDWVLPEASMTGTCTKTDCKVHVSLAGFGALNPVDVHLVGLGIPGSELQLGTLTADRWGAAKGAFRFERPATTGDYYVAVVTGAFDFYIGMTNSEVGLDVP